MSNTISGVTIQITKGYVTGDTLCVFSGGVCVNSLPGHSIGWTYANGTLSLTGVDTLADYTTVLDNVRFIDDCERLGETPIDSGGDLREVTWSVGSGNLVQVNVQEQGVLEQGQAVYADAVATCSTAQIWCTLGFAGYTYRIDTVNGTLLDDVSLSGATADGLIGKPAGDTVLQVYLDANGKETLTQTATPKIDPANTWSDGRGNLPGLRRSDVRRVVLVDRREPGQGRQLQHLRDAERRRPDRLGVVEHRRRRRHRQRRRSSSTTARASTPTLSQQITGLIPGAIYQVSFAY